MKENRQLLIVEDSDEDFEVTCWALKKAGCTLPITRCVRAEEVLLHLCPLSTQMDLSGQTPSLVMLDLNLPGINGLQLLEELRRAEYPLMIPVVILSTSKNPKDIAASYRLGAAGFICKPLSLDLFVEKIRGLVNYWFDTVTLHDEDK